MNKEDVVKIIKKCGINIFKDLAPIQAESEYTIDLDALKDISLLDIPTQFATIRNINFKNEWHDENLTQINIYVLKNKVGLGTVKKIAQDLIAEIDKDAAVEWKSEYIEYLVPAMEALVDGKNPIGGGFVRNNIMNVCGLEGINAVVISIIVERL